MLFIKNKTIFEINLILIACALKLVFASNDIEMQLNSNNSINYYNRNSHYKLRDIGETTYSSFNDIVYNYFIKLNLTNYTNLRSLYENYSDYTDDLIDHGNSLYKVPWYIITILSILYGTISILAVLGNGLIMWVVLKNKRMHNVTNYFISNLALADIVIGVFATPFQVIIISS